MLIQDFHLFNNIVLAVNNSENNTNSIAKKAVITKF